MTHVLLIVVKEASLVFYLQSQLVTVQLNEIETLVHGISVLPGVTGLGLPNVSVQWLGGAGEGVRYRGRIFLPRDVDLPILNVGKTETQAASPLPGWIIPAYAGN